MGADDADLIRLVVPADAALLPLVEVAVAVLGRRAGFSEGEIGESRTAVAAAVAEVVQADSPDDVELEVRLSSHSLTARLSHGGRSTTLVLP